MSLWWSYLIVCLGTLLLATALEKAFNFEWFVATLEQYRLRSKHVRLSAVVWISAELLASVSLIIPSDRRFELTCLVLAAATGSVWRRVRQGASHDCGCTSHGSQIEMGIVKRNIALMSVLIGAEALSTNLILAAFLGLSSFMAAGLAYLAVGHANGAANQENDDVPFQISMNARGVDLKQLVS